MKELQTERLILRKVNLLDASFMLELLNDPSFVENIADRGVRTERDAEHYLMKGPLRSYRENGFGMYLVEEKKTGLPLGVCGLVKRSGLDDIDIGFAFLPRYWRNGFAFEASKAVLDHALGFMGLKRLVGITNQNNLGSIRILEKLGMKYERMVILPGESVEIRLYATELNEMR